MVEENPKEAAIPQRLISMARRPRKSDPAIEPVIRVHRRQHRKADAGLVRRAYATAKMLHEGQSRKSGEPYISHPVAVTLVLAELGADSATLAAALLHDTVEDTPYPLPQLAEEFGDEIGLLVDGVTKLDGSKWGERAEAETYRKMILAAAADLRVLVIKLADRLHNLRTLGFQPRPKQERTARQSVELLIPFAARLGIYALKREMDDLCFAVLQPEQHQAVAAAVDDTEPQARERLEPVRQLLQDELDESKIKARVVLHRRHLWAIHTDRRRLDALRPGDLFRLLVIVDGEPTDCYLALGSVHTQLRPVPGRMKDFVAIPRFNQYRSLHTQVIDPEFDVLDVMIRTDRMHREAEVGIVADITGPGGAPSAGGRRDLEWLRQLLAWQTDASSADFLESLRGELRPGNIITFTPQGDPVVLPDGATPIDFAYALSTDLGTTAVGAVINGRLAALSAPLVNGQVVEILTATEGTASPSPAWLEFAKTPTAQLQIRRWLEGRQIELASEQGRARLAKALADQDIDLMDLEISGTALSVALQLGHHNLDQLYASLQAERLEVDDLIDRLLNSPPREQE